MKSDLTPMKSNTKENTIMANAPTISKNDSKLLKKDTASMFINAKPARMEAKNNKIVSLIHYPPLVTIDYVLSTSDDWIISL